ncbi:MFS transporter [bacterium M00.F.Ca.ET.228.01.1.1]|uniref:MFS transporter n=1 Tax=Paraburkholderia phenoliruptrix TaxID=252970 RepID=UPI001091B9E7|nr:MFS transporter [Paraburkholderia phenoliruptrix]TGP47499.1 MFS transporter [bacterium M00.F.Ca.ET.228.01.1.1]TGS05292.1 MFS transporter [bacterium M00.F.Ca.ET.191.01.1.1]TGU10228.1 MFS transporter [bacterium M00.F.Ca.ET.155.01.1.1]MBW0445722.1 MFS transporter [Paraburkholderia phenoliruptrix]MBW9096487.1 MFS transporter [Paraburkholderia phenoliruptrix]
MSHNEESAAAAGAPASVATRPYAIAVGIAVLGLYASQALVNDLATSVGLGAWANMVTMFTLTGYAAGLLLLVPLVDLLPNRRLILATLGAQALSLAVLAAARDPVAFLAASFCVGLTSSAIQMLLPVVASQAPEAERGRVVGDVMSGLMVGVLLSRPAASLIAGACGWRSYYAIDAAALAAMSVWLWTHLPERRPLHQSSYGALLGSLLHLVRDEPVLRRRALYQGLLMVSFNLFWTSVALKLANAPLRLGHLGIGLFALAGAGSTIIAPVAGRLGDRGLDRQATIAFHTIVVLAAGIGLLGGSESLPPAVSLALLVVAALLLDLGVIGDQAMGRRAVNLLNPQARGRVNGLFTGLFFVGSAIGALLAGPAWALGHWTGICIAAAVFALAANVLHVWQTTPSARSSQTGSVADPRC